MTETNLDKLLGQNVTLIGAAKDAKAGAVLVTDEEDVIYIEGLPYWPDELIDKIVLVEGLLTEEKFIPDPCVDENDGISTGAVGIQIVLKNATWKINERML